MKRITLIILAFVMCISLTACPSTDSENSASPEKDSGTAAEKSEFSPKDVKDETIDSISTYGDYLTMYQLIIKDYYAKYEKAIKGTVLWSEEAFTIIKQTQDEVYEQQKKLYGDMLDTPIVGKNDLADALKELRDELGEYVKSMEDTLNSFGGVFG